MEWIRVSLTQRLMQVRVSDVPQDSVLGILIFLLYINHVVSGLTYRFKIFADDVKLYLAHENTPSANDLSVLHRDIDLTSSYLGSPTIFHSSLAPLLTPLTSSSPFS